jgi:hypothetical protein
MGARCLTVRAVLMVRLRMMMVPHRGMPVAVVHVSKRHRRGTERDYDEDSKSLLENAFHENPGGSKGVSHEKRDAKPQATAMRRHSSALADAESPDEVWEHVRDVQNPADVLGSHKDASSWPRTRAQLLTNLTCLAVHGRLHPRVV